MKGQGVNRDPSVAGFLRTYLSRGSLSALGIRKQECVPMEIIERGAITVRRRAEKSTPECVLIFVARAYAIMVSIGKLPEFVQAEIRDNFGNLRRHPDQQHGQANVFSRRVPGYRQDAAGHLHANNPREYGAAARSAIRSLSAPCVLPPIAVSELKVGEDEGALTCPVACICFQLHPKSPMDTQDLGQSSRVSPLCRTRKTFEIPIVECLDQLKVRASWPTRHRYCRERARLLRLPGSIGHLRSPQSGVDNVLLKHLGRTSNRLRVVADMHC